MQDNTGGGGDPHHLTFEEFRCTLDLTFAEGPSTSPKRKGRNDKCNKKTLPCRKCRLSIRDVKKKQTFYQKLVNVGEFRF